MDLDILARICYVLDCTPADIIEYAPRCAKKCGFYAAALLFYSSSTNSLLHLLICHKLS